MNLSKLKPNYGWICSSYNEDIDSELNNAEINPLDGSDQLDYYIHIHDCEEGSTAYLYKHETAELHKMIIVKIIKRSTNFVTYDKLVESDDVLIDGERDYDADTSAEFITVDDCYLVWLDYADED
ncbi:hypothetical protein J6A31_05735 [bacterium]|nr:hypothetical protein [bacterium]